MKVLWVMSNQVKEKLFLILCKIESGTKRNNLILVFLYPKSKNITVSINGWIQSISGVLIIMNIL